MVGRSHRKSRSCRPEKVLKADMAVGNALNRAYEEAVKEAEKMEEFAGEHPVLTGVFLTVVALGVLYLWWPLTTEALGFGELGPIEGVIVVTTTEPSMMLTSSLGTVGSFTAG